MSRVFWDTNLFIYVLEDKGHWSERTRALRQRMREREDQLFTSSMTLGEVLHLPTAAGDLALCRRYEMAILRSAVVVPFDTEAARRYAEIRQDRSIKPPDAIQLACAAVVGADLFVTNDQHLQSKMVRGIHFITSLERAPL